MHSGDPGDGGRRRQNVPSVEAGSSKKSKKVKDLELDIYRNRDLLAYDGWEDLPEPWTCQQAYDYIGFAHLDRLYPEGSHEEHCRLNQLTYNNIIDVEIKWRFLEVLRAICHETRWPKNTIPRRIATMVYVESVLHKRVDWSTIQVPLLCAGNVGQLLGDNITSRLPINAIPRTRIPEWFRRNASLVDPPGVPLPADRKVPRKRVRIGRRVPEAAIGQPQDVAMVDQHQNVAADNQHRDVAAIGPDQDVAVVDDLWHMSGGSNQAGPSRNEVIERGMAHVNITNVPAQQYEQLRAEYDAYKAQMEEREKISALKTSTLEEEKNQLVVDMARLQVELNETRDRNSKYEADVIALQRDAHNLNTERESMMLGTVLAASRAKQYEAEFTKIAAEWTSNHRLRALLLTSWPTLEHMYPETWDDVDPPVYKANGSIDWSKVMDEDHRWDIKETVDGSTTSEKIWREVQPMVMDGDKCSLCLNPWGPEGRFTLGSCGHSYHPQCLIEDMIRKRTCNICKSPYHARLYLQFGLRDFMPIHWVYRQENHPFFDVGADLGKPLEWNWRFNVSNAELQAANEAMGTLRDPENIMRAAEGLYPNKPPDYGLKMFFYNVMGWHFDRERQTLLKDVGPGPHYNSEGELAQTNEQLNALFRGLEDVQDARDAEVAIVAERTYHHPQLKAKALEIILNDISPELKVLLDALRNKRRRGTEVPRASYGYQPRRNDGASSSR
jgi:hypothetical protein